MRLLQAKILVLPMKTLMVSATTLKPGAEVRICFDLVATGTPFPCNPYVLSINPSFYYHYESACGETIELRDNPNVYTRYFGRVNKTSFPAQLLMNAPEKGRIAPNMNSVGVSERFSRRCKC